MTPQPLRPISYRNDPLGTVSVVPPTLAEYDFLLTGTTNDDGDRTHSVTVDPVALHLPWRSSFPAARQCKYWSEAEDAGRKLLQQLKRMDGAAITNNGHTNQAEMPLSRKEQERIVNAASAAGYMNPNCTAEAIEIIAQLNLILWIHDDILESSDSPHEVVNVQWPCEW
ncbi:uncharacterized protein BP01DRAFT_222734 [Aspergillus saccharolyticus JOP 1030-1]|uniref:Uncharacterized protein n=1 Tax=Aspergillus saccharolyticus JOP 1030-1 TaxID=1450539 RepID=A0A318Z6D0_9EURO|nr:hypothetical protein BP01DRAFT_222734 [Aspergillus saccharolyticus JOP 1030-1]PYH40343.1 hypothetical protein BP01DRAFT_222734 [Aspergillus saccharolyticus JOP 1030-1]